jgi:hypothetical protein
VILVARRELVPVLTSNFSHLPRDAQRHGVESFGVLRVVEELVQLSIVDPPMGADGIRAMMEAGSYLPEAECPKLVARLTERGS